MEEIAGSHDPHVSSRAKDDLFADPPRSEDAPADPDGEGPEAVLEEVPEEHPHGNYDVKAKASTLADADFDAEETNKKEDTT